MLALALYWATLVPAYFSFGTFLEIINLENDSSKLVAWGYVGSCIISAREIHSAQEQQPTPDATRDIRVRTEC